MLKQFCDVYAKAFFHLSAMNSVNIYLAASQLGKYPLLFTSTSVNNCSITFTYVHFGPQTVQLVSTVYYFQQTQRKKSYKKVRYNKVIVRNFN